MVDGASKDLEHLLGKLGDPLPVQAGTSGNGRYLLVETKRGGRFVRVMIEASCGAAQVTEAVASALAILARGASR